ncbi:MAG: hypothetical protein E6R03_16070 [Hyphomicrobiaceae bacterium]|nr:MAG: hypothetical protein E6R03_16070 [Hyphomicrobiaceae bacterium]
MSILIRLLLIACAVLSAAPVSAQVTRLGPNHGISISWPAVTPVDPDGLDVPSGYRVRATSTRTPAVWTWDTAASVTTLTLTPQMIPVGAFTISVQAFNEAGEAPTSNVTGPFGRAMIPPTLTGVSAAVVAGAP